MRVLKFGGSSVSSSKNIGRVFDIVDQFSKKQKIVVVVSAFGKTTDALVEGATLASQKNRRYIQVLKDLENYHLKIMDDLFQNNNLVSIVKYVKQLFNEIETIYKGCFLLKELTPKTLAKVTSYGELLSSNILAKAASTRFETVYKDARELIIASNDYDYAQVDFSLTNKNCQEYFSNHSQKVTILPGFVARTVDGKTTTLGRGGSDYTASIIAAALSVTELQIWTDVSGVFTADPKMVKYAFEIERISYHEVLELSHFGAKVIYPPTIQPLLQKEIPIRIKNTFRPADKGTLITKKIDNNQPVKGISHIEKISLLTISGSGIIENSCFSKRLFDVLYTHNINTILITHASSELSICIAVSDDDAFKAKKSIDQAFEYEIQLQGLKPVKIEPNLCIIALVGDNMKKQQGLSGKMFSVLEKNNININAIALGASEKNIIAVIHKKDAKKGLNSIHERFFEERMKELNLFINGLGNVGERFLAQLNQQEKFLRKNLKLKIQVVGISNSKTMFFYSAGIDLTKWKLLLEQGEEANASVFLSKVISLNLRNSIFIDVTASEQVSEMYQNYLDQNIGVITCNKIACSSSLKNYKALKKLSIKSNTPFLFETNIGAGLPIIGTLKNLVNSGDKVRKIQAVLSGSLNFVFNSFNSETTFYDIVTKVVAKGYTESNPKVDLSGVDAARKILILARESGFELELENVINHSFLPEEAMRTTNIDDFYASLKKYENHFQMLYSRAMEQNCRLRYVAEFEENTAKVGLQQIAPSHPFYNLCGKDLIVLFFTDRYSEQPLMIKGAGTGADLTAAGIFSDVIRIGNP